MRKLYRVDKDPCLRTQTIITSCYFSALFKERQIPQKSYLGSHQGSNPPLTNFFNLSSVSQLHTK